jgi:CheY-like chemotaxis protein
MTTDVVAEREAVAGEGVLLVEDRESVREPLTDLLIGRGYRVAAADTGHSAILQARRGRVGVVLMDIHLGEGIDGIEAARRIQEEQPLTSFIFVTAYGDDPNYRRRVEESRLRVGEWVPKPFEVEDLVRLIDREQQRLQLLAELFKAKAEGVPPLAYLQARAYVDQDLPGDILKAVRKEVEVTAIDGGARPLEGGEGQESLMVSVSVEIDTLYDRLRAVIAESADTPGYRTAFRALRAKLDELLEIEADLLEERYLSRLRFDPARAERAEARARELLERE